ncbi:hypothetical protein [Streptomyces sp. NPDC002403]
MAASHDQYRDCGDVVTFAACTAARTGEISGCRVGDIDTTQRIWTVGRQTAPAPGGLTGKGTKGKRARKVPTVAKVRPLIAQPILSAGAALSVHLGVQRAPRSPPSPIAVTRRARAHRPPTGPQE